MARTLNRPTRGTGRVAAVVAFALMAALFALPGTALAAVPVVSTGAPTGVTKTSATLNGTVNPEGDATTKYGFYYADGDSEWCTSGGTSGGYSGGAATTLGFADSTSHSVTLDYLGLTRGKSYCYLVYASNASNPPNQETKGSQVTFTTLNPVPVVSTGSASAITGTSATLNATVNPQGESTQYYFEYNYANSQWCQTGGATGSAALSPVTTLGFSDSTAHAVSATINAGNPGTAWCFRVKATNAGTSAVGGIASFTTTARVVITGAASAIANGGATLSGTINPEGQPTSFPDGYSFRYGPSSSNFCTSGGTSTVGSLQTQLTALGFSDSSDHPVSGEVEGGLSPSTTYCYQLVFLGTSGNLATFTTPSPVTLTVDNVTGSGLVTEGSGLALDGPGDYGDFSIYCGGQDPILVHVEFKDCSATFVQGTEVVLSEATYLEQFGEWNGQNAKFAGWTGACSGTGPTCTVTMTGDRTVGAKFDPISSPPPSPAAISKAVNAVLTPSGPAAKLGAILKAGSYPAAFNAPAAGTAHVDWFQVPPGAHISSVHKPVLVATGAKTLTTAGKATIKIKLTAKGKALIKKVKGGHKLKLTAKGSFTPKGGKKTSKVKSFSLKR